MLIMHHFGELSFTATHCKRTCDVCEANAAAGLLAPAGEETFFTLHQQVYSSDALANIACQLLGHAARPFMYWPVLLTC